MSTRGWTCFHCGEHFDDNVAGRERAREHFGEYIGATPACQIWGANRSWRRGYRLLIRQCRSYYGELRDLQRRVSSEDTAKDREINSMMARHRAELIEQEELGYARGLADGRREMGEAYSRGISDGRYGGPPPSEEDET